MAKSIKNWELQEDIRWTYKKALKMFDNIDGLDVNFVRTLFVRIQYLDRYLDKRNWFDISVTSRDGVKGASLYLCLDNKYGNRDRLQLAAVSTDATEGMICKLFEHLIYKNLGKLKRKD